MIRKSNTQFFIISFLSAILILGFFTACEKSKDSNPVNKYLVDYKLVMTTPVSISLASVNLLSLNYHEASALLQNTKYDVEIYNISYKTHYKTQEIIASGLIYVPSANEQFPVISFQNGTNTINANAPSVNPTNPSFLLLQSFSANGYIIVIPDYIGFGATSDYTHPYYVTEPTNNAVIDLMHAAQEFFATATVKAQTNNRTYLMGYSQGGWATLAAFKQLENGNDSINVIAASCGAGAYNLINASNYIASQLTFPGPLYLPYYIYSHQQYGTISEPLNYFFNEPYASRIPQLFDGNHNSGQINSELNDTVSALLKSELVASLKNSDLNDSYGLLKADLTANSVTAWQLKGLLRFYHGNSDDNVPVSESQNIYQDFLTLNPSDKVEYFEMNGLNHETGLVPWGIQTLLWFNANENK
jgi:pimeloyl-ACP methyl ester carboxylesterase